MFKTMFNYKPSDDKVLAINEFLGEQSPAKTMLIGAAFSGVGYIACFATNRLFRSAENRINEARFDSHVIKRATAISLELASRAD